MRRLVRQAIIGLAALLATGLADPVGAAMRRREAERVDTVEARPVGAPLMAIVSLSNQRVTIYDADGWIYARRSPAANPDMRRQLVSTASFKKRRNTTPTSMMTPQCLSCSVLLGRASRSMRGFCPDTPPLTAVSACHMSSPNVSSA